MPSLSVARTANVAAAPKYRPVALFLGGTSGIGQAIAEAFAEVTKGNSHIVICGRNQSAASDIFSKLPTVPPTPSSSTESGSKYEFESCDATLMSNVRETTQSLLGRLPKLNYLVLTPGFLTLRGRDETSEGMDKKLALHYYARWRFVHDLMPLLENAKTAGEDARVLTVLGAGANGKLDVKDLGLKHGYSLKAAADNATAMNDLAVEELAAQHPDIAFIHASPGAVMTQGATNFHWTTRLLAPIAKLITVQPDVCAQWMLYTLLDPQFSKGTFFRDNHAEEVGANKYSTAELRKLVWEHTLASTSGAST